MAFGARGDTVALLARGEAGLAGAKRNVEAVGGSALVIPVDVANSDAVFAAAERVESDLGEIDVWVNVAFTSVFAPFDQIKPEEYRRVTDVSYLGYILALRGILTRHSSSRPLLPSSRIRRAPRTQAPTTPWKRASVCSQCLQDATLG